MASFTLPDCTVRSFEGSWAKEIIMTPHNAMRVEMQDVFRAMMAMQFKGEHVPVDDLRHFFEFWDVFEHFLYQHHEVEEKALWPLVRRRCALPHSSHEEIFIAVEKIKTLKQKIGFMHAPDIAKALFANISEFGQVLMDHFAQEEDEIAQVIQRHFRESEKAAFEDLINQHMNSNPDAKQALAVSLRWMTKRQQLNWMKKNLSLTSRMKYKYFWKPELEKTHLHPLNKIINSSV